MTSRRPHQTAPATLIEVARRAGVSASTVSRILNGSARVSPDKRATVERAIAELDFRPNALAQSLKRGRSMTVGVLTPAVDSPLLNETLRGVDCALSDQAYIPLIVSGHWNAEDESRRIELLIAQRVDGIVALSSALSHAQLVALARRVPLVAIGRDFQSAGALTVAVDNRLGSYLATRHLIGLGHSRIVHIQGAPGRTSALERLAGYRQALDEAGIAVDPALQVQGDWYESGGEAAMQDLLARGVEFTAVFAANDQMAAGARLALFRAGLAVPQQVSLVGFDAIPSSAYMTPPLTTVSVHMFDVGRQATALLLRHIAGDAQPAAALPPELIVRESTAPRHG
jgi:LacI family transcriptional regulator